jgi:hypothetical protein
VNRNGRTESVVQILIVILIGGMAGAASFTHVHDWTMQNVPEGTSGWFGWANAVISELTPTAAGLEIRRRKRHNQTVAYPMAILIAAAALSITAQVAQAKPSATGWLVAIVPALAFLALTKLVISRTSATAEEAEPVASLTEIDQNQATEPVPPELLTGARMAAFTYQQTTGRTITVEVLASRLAVTDDLAARLIYALDDTGPEHKQLGGETG